MGKAEGASDWSNLLQIQTQCLCSDTCANYLQDCMHVNTEGGPKKHQNSYSRTFLDVKIARGD